MTIDPSIEHLIWSAIGRPSGAPPLRFLRLMWLDDAAIASFSRGVIRTSACDTESFIPIPGGLFDEQVFGQIPRLRTGCADVWAMLDQRYKRYPSNEDRTAGFVSERIPIGWYGRWGHIPLPIPARHPWLTKSELAPSITTIPVLPPGFRPCVPLDGQVADSDINCAYRDVLDAGHNAVLLQRTIGVLFANESLDEPLSVNGRIQRSITGLVSPEQRWQALKDLDNAAARSATALTDPLPEPHFSTLAYLRAICIGIELAR